MKKKLLISLVLLCILAALCIQGPGALALQWVDDLLADEEGTLNEGGAINNNYGILFNKGTVVNNHNYITNAKTGYVENNKKGAVIVNVGTVKNNYGTIYNSGTVTNNEGKIYYPVSLKAGHATVAYGPGTVRHDIGESIYYWMEPDQEVIIYLTPDQGYFTSGIKGYDWITSTEQNGVWTIRYSKDRPKTALNLTLGDLQPIAVSDNPSGKTVKLANGQTMQKNYGTVDSSGTIVENWSVVLNNKGGVVKTNKGNVYNYGGTIENNEGTEYYLVQILADHAQVRYGSGFINFASVNFWLAAGGTGSVEIEPEEGYTLPTGNVPNWMSVSENNGVFTVTLLENHQVGSYSLNLNVVPNNKRGDNPEGRTATLDSGYTMDNNRGVLENYGTLKTNYGTVRNREGGKVLDNQGTVYNYGGTISENNGTELYSVDVFATEHANVEYTRGFTSDAGKQWITPGAEAGMLITPQDGWCLDDYEAPDWVQVTEGNNYQVTIPANRPDENILIKVKTSNVRSDNPAGKTAKLYQGQYMENNDGTLEVEETAILNRNKSGGRIEVQKGLVRNNLGIITRNYQTGTVEKNDGSLEHNWGTMNENDNYVGINYPGAAVGTNNQSLRINQGAVTVNAGQIDTNEESGTIGTNNGTILNPNEGIIGTNNRPVTTNTETGIIQENNSTVSTNAGTIERNIGTVNVNTGTVWNYEGGVVADNRGTVSNYGGVVTANSGDVTEFYTVDIFFSHTAEYGGGFVEIDGRYWLGPDQTGTITITPDDPNFLIGIDSARTDVTAVSNGDGTGTVTITNPTGHVELREAVRYQITTAVEHGTLAADRQTAVPGEVVTLTLAPEGNAYLGSMKVMCGSREIQTTATGENTRTFIMPEGDVTATALFTSSCFVAFVNWDGRMLQYDGMESGQTPVYNGETPVREPNAMYEFTFTGWEPEISEVEFGQTSVVYTATYSYAAREYPVAFVDWEGNVLQSGSCAYGETPVYTGETPTMDPDEYAIYTFTGWYPEIEPVSGPAIYMADFDDTPIIYPGENAMIVTKWQKKECPFTPAESGDYRIWSTGDEVHLDCGIIDDTGRRLTLSKEDMYWWNINTDGRFDFEYLVHLEGGKNYTLSLEPGFDSGFVSIWVEKVDMYTIHYQDVEHATAMVDDMGGKAWKGQWIEPFYMPEEGYALVEMSVRDAQGRPLEQKPEEEFTYLMPASDVYVTATFAPAGLITLEQAYNMSFSAGVAMRIEREEENLLIYAAQGAKAEFTVETDEGYALDTLTVTTESGSAVEYDTYRLSPSKLKFWFTMPTENVIIAMSTSRGCTVSFVTREGSGRMPPVAASTDKPYTLPACGFTAELFMEFAGWQVGDNAGELKQPGETITLTGDTTLKATWKNVELKFDNAFILPENLKRISEEAFAGSPVNTVIIQDSCTSIGAYAFMNCRDLCLIRIPAGCAIGDHAFDGCMNVYIFGTVGSPAEAYCTTHANCTFVPEAQN